MITLSSTAKKDPVPALVKICQVAKLLNVSRHTVHHLIESGDLQASDVSSSQKLVRRHKRVTRESLLGFYKQRFGHHLNHPLENPFQA